jgi:hypothetical protein
LLAGNRLHQFDRPGRAGPGRKTLKIDVSCWQATGYGISTGPARPGPIRAGKHFSKDFISIQGIDLQQFDRPEIAQSV